uniref:Stomatin-like protein 2 n=1 Tax=Rhizophora mucronata TaxID=61149 RepID=A0A2P2IZH1_RHIMU
MAALTPRGGDISPGKRRSSKASRTNAEGK